MMNKCPTCNRDYDSSLGFCPEDGAALVRTDQSPDPMFTEPPQPEFLPPPPPPGTPQVSVEPSLSTLQSLVNIFFAPARVFDSFRDVTTFAPLAVRFLVAAAIIVTAAVAYNVIYLARMGSENIARASIEVTPRVADLPPEQKERALQMQQNPAFRAVTLLMSFGQLILLLLVSLPLGALIYWLGTMIFKGRVKYLQVLLVWTYAALPPKALWMMANTLVVLIHPPSTNIGIATGINGVVPANLGALFDVTTLPVPVYVAAFGVLDLFALYGLALALIGLRKVARIPWIGSFVIVIFVWLIGVVWHISTAGVVAALIK